MTMLASRAARRRAVLLLYVALGLLTVALVAVRVSFGAGHRAMGWILSALLLGSGLVLATMLDRVVRAGKAVADGRDAELDERQRSVRHAAQALAYRIGSGAVAALAVYALLSERLALWMPRTYDDWFAVAWPLLMLLTTLPNAIMAWREPEGLEGGLREMDA